MSQRSDKLKIIADALGFRIQWWLGNEPGGYLEKCAAHAEALPPRIRCGIHAAPR